MKIEVSTAASDTTKDKGDLLEELANVLLSAQNYKVTTEIRFTGVELDLLCKHNVSGKEIYVECKAHRENISATVLISLIGVKAWKKYDEAWLISTANFGKEAKGVLEEWQSRPKEESSGCSFYTPDMVIDTLINSKIIIPPPNQRLLGIVKEENNIGEWILLVTKYGKFWAVTYLKSGDIYGIILFYANNGTLIEDEKLLAKVAKTDSSLSTYNFLVIKEITNKGTPTNLPKSVEVVQVQHGDAWSDYRPSRAADFVGRKSEQDKIFSLFADIKKKETKTRIFALTGDSGMGKSSLINQLSEIASRGNYKKNTFLFAVDVRAAKDTNYIYSSLLACLKAAQNNNFGNNSINLRITNASSPLSSSSIESYLQSLEEKDQVICLVFDQFEELYSKEDLFEVFEKAKNLFLEAISILSNFCLGFAWKSDSTISNEHPAYYMWHKLEDSRMTLKLKPFTNAERKAALKIFEKELKRKLQNDLKHNILVSSQGYPWLLKKLCIHLYEKINAGVDQKQLVETLDVKLLFENDMKDLSDAEISCLRIIASKAPVDAYKISEMSGLTVLNSLTSRRLVIRSGEKVNIYWDIFKEYLLTGNTPLIPLHYLPSNEFTSISKIGRILNHETSISIKDLADKSSLTEKTVHNICSDLVMFDIAIRKDGGITLNKEIYSASDTEFLKIVRSKLTRHAFTEQLYKTHNQVITTDEAIIILKDILSSSRYNDKTWRTYTIRLCRWLVLCGLINIKENSTWGIKELGVINPTAMLRRNKRSNIFIPLTSPAQTIQAFNWLIAKNDKISKGDKLPKGYSTAFVILNHFNILKDGKKYLVNEKYRNNATIVQEMWLAASAEPMLIDVVELLRNNPRLNYLQISNYLVDKHALSWKPASKKRNGQAVRQWALWILNSRYDEIAPLPGRTSSKNSITPEVCIDLFSESESADGDMQKN